MNTSLERKLRAEVFVFLAAALFRLIGPSRLWKPGTASLLRDANWIMHLMAVATLMGLGMASGSTGAKPESALRRPTNIAPQELARALQILASDRDVQLVYRSELVGGRRTQGADGVLTLDEALTQLLLGSGLIYRYLDDKAITIVKSNTRKPPESD